MIAMSSDRAPSQGRDFVRSPFAPNGMSVKAKMIAFGFSSVVTKTR